MNNQHNKIDAAASAQFFGRYSFVRQLAVGVMLAGAVMSAAHAGPNDRDADAQRAMQAQRAERQQPPADRQERVRQFDNRQFEARAEEQRRQLQQEQDRQNAESSRRGGRLTPDERRELRRQINDAGTELYPRSPRR